MKDELPEDWGLLTYTGRTLLQAKAARERKPAELDHFIVAAILRRATEHMTPRPPLTA